MDEDLEHSKGCVGYVEPPVLWFSQAGRGETLCCRYRLRMLQPIARLEKQTRRCALVSVCAWENAVILCTAVSHVCLSRIDHAGYPLCVPFCVLYTLPGLSLSMLLPSIMESVRETGSSLNQCVFLSPDPLNPGTPDKLHYSGSSCVQLFSYALGLTRDCFSRSSPHHFSMHVNLLISIN